MVMLKASFLVVVFSMGVLCPERTEQETSKEAERTTDEGR